MGLFGFKHVQHVGESLTTFGVLFLLQSTTHDITNGIQHVSVPSERMEKYDFTALWQGIASGVPVLVNEINV